MPPLLTVRDLAISFTRGAQGQRAVDGLQLSIHAGQTVALVGESGCGKSVSALAIMGLLAQPPALIEGGSIQYKGCDLLSLSAPRMRAMRGREIAMIFQEPMSSLNPVFTIGDQIIEAVQLHRPVKRHEASAIAIEALREVGIAQPAERMKQFPHEFSGGMRQRVMIAMALACQPSLLLADEPTTALDVTIQAQILALLRDLQIRRGLAILLITHDLGIVAENADVVCVMYAGKVVEYARVDVLFANPIHPYTKALFASRATLSVRRPRLDSIAHILAQPNSFKPVPGDGGVRTPWWPSTSIGSDRLRAYALAEIDTEHWVGCWGTPDAQPHRHPDIAAKCKSAELVAS